MWQTHHKNDMHLSKRQWRDQSCMGTSLNHRLPGTDWIWLSTEVSPELEKGGNKSPSKEDRLNDYGTSMQQNTVWSLKRSRQLCSTDMIQCWMKKAKHRPQWQAIRYDVWCKCWGHAPAHTDHRKQETLLGTAMTSGEGNWECEGWNGRKTSSSLQTLS